MDNFADMKNFFSLISLISFIVLFKSCDTDFDVNAEAKEIIVVYALLDKSRDTQYVKINKAFLGENNALIMAQNSGSTNFLPSDLEVKVYKSTSNEVIDSVYLVDTVLVKEEGIFANDENIIYYFVNNNFLNGNSNYSLNVKNVNTQNSVNSNTNIINSFSFNNFNSNAFLFGFYNPSQPDTLKFLSKTMEWNKVTNGEIYQLDLRFNYNEDDGNNLTNKSLLFSQPLEEFTGGVMTSTIEGSKFFNFLQQNIQENENVVRRFLSIDIIMTIGTPELNTYIKVNEPITGIVQHRPQYSNIDNGIGLFSSRYTHTEYNIGLTTDSRNYLKNELNRSFE